MDDAGARAGDARVLADQPAEIDRAVAIARPASDQLERGLGRLDAQGRVGLEQALARARELGRDARGQGRVLARERHRVEVALVASLAELVAAEQLVKHRSDRVEIDGRLARAPAQLLGRHVAQLALHVQTRGLFVGQPRDAEVGQLDLARDRAEHVLRRDVAMHDGRRAAVVMERVGIGEAAQDLADHVGGHLGREALALGQEVAREFGQVEPVDPLHDHEALALDLADVEHLDDVGVGQQHREPGLFDEHLAVAGVVGDVLGQQLDRHGFARPTHRWPAPHPDLGHSAGSDLAQQLVLTQPPQGSKESRSGEQGVNRGRHRRREARMARSWTTDPKIAAGSVGDGHVSLSAPTSPACRNSPPRFSAAGG